MMLILIKQNAPLPPKKNNTYHTVGTVPKSNRKIAEKSKIDTPSTNKQTSYFPGLVQALQRKVAGSNQFYTSKPLV